MVDKLSENWHAFQTGDVIVTYYPVVPNKLLHLTVYFEARHNNGVAGFAHASGEGLIIEANAGYKELGGFLHARCVDPDRAARGAEAAAIWARTATRTPYGSFPRATDAKVGGTGVKGANRFSGMRDTAALTEIEFEPAALLRLMKWTLRLKTDAPLSVLRGITCAAFVVACHQASAMMRFLRDANGLNKLDDDMLGKFAALFEKKADVRARAGLLKAELTQQAQATLEMKSKSNTVYVGQAAKNASNRNLLETTLAKFANQRVAIGKKTQDFPGIFDSNHAVESIPDVELLWINFQNMLGINQAVMQPLDTIIPTDFLFDAKYVNSKILTRILESSQAWRTKAYQAY